MLNMDYLSFWYFSTLYFSILYCHTSIYFKLLFYSVIDALIYMKFEILVDLYQNVYFDYFLFRLPYTLDNWCISIYLANEQVYFIYVYQGAVHLTGQNI